MVRVAASRDGVITAVKGGGHYRYRDDRHTDHRRCNADDCLRDACSQDRGGLPLEVAASGFGAGTPDPPIKGLAIKKARAPASPSLFGSGSYRNDYHSPESTTAPHQSKDPRGRRESGPARRTPEPPLPVRRCGAPPPRRPPTAPSAPGRAPRRRGSPPHPTSAPRWRRCSLHASRRCGR